MPTKIPFVLNEANALLFGSISIFVVLSLSEHGQTKSSGNLYIFKAWRMK